jgi:hypothetical protein
MAASEANDTKRLNDLPDPCLHAIILQAGPRALAATAATCKTWQATVEDDVLWETCHQQHYGKVLIAMPFAMPFHCGNPTDMHML